MTQLAECQTISPASPEAPDRLEPLPVGLDMGGEMTPARLRTWVREAQPGARTIYCQGSNASMACDRALREAVWELAEKGWLRPHHVKLGPGKAVQIVVRSARRLLAGERV